MQYLHRFGPIPMALCSLAGANALAQAEPTTNQRVEINASLPLKINQTASGASRLGLTVRELPAAVHVLNRADLDAASAIDTQDALAGIPGLRFSAQPGAAGAVFYRGFGASSLAQLYNGISVQYDAVSARPLDSWLVERIEAIGGPSSFLNGSGAVGGSINIITKTADLRGDLSQLHLGTGDQRQLALSLQRSLGNPDHGTDHDQVLRVDANVTRGALPTQGRARDTWQVAASWRAALGSRLSHRLSLEQQHERLTQPYWSTPLLHDAGNAGNAGLGQVGWDPRTVDVNYNVQDGRYEQDVRWLRSITAWQPAAGIRHTAHPYPPPP